MVNKHRLHRSELAVPGSNLRMIEKAPRAGADCVFIDLEDAVAPDAKPDARAKAVAAVRSRAYGNRELTIRCNGLDTEWGAERHGRRVEKISAIERSYTGTPEGKDR